MSWLSKWLRSGGKQKLVAFALDIAWDLPPAEKREKILQALERIEPVLAIAGVSQKTQDLVRQAIDALKAEGVGS
jgi:hypothetical protein